MPSVVLEAGPNQVIVVYSPADTGVEIDVAAVYGEVAVDATDRSASGWRIVSTAALPTRHAQAFHGSQWQRLRDEDVSRGRLLEALTGKGRSGAGNRVSVEPATDVRESGHQVADLIRPSWLGRRETRRLPGRSQDVNRPRREGSEHDPRAPASPGHRRRCGLVVLMVAAACGTANPGGRTPSPTLATINEPLPRRQPRVRPPARAAARPRASRSRRRRPPRRRLPAVFLL